MTAQPRTKLIHEGHYAAEVDVTLIDDDNGWGPCLTLLDAEKLDAVRLALRAGDVKEASRFARIFELTPVEA